MSMHVIDWGIVAALLAVLVWGALTTKRYTRSVAGFLAAERCGGRYLIAVADNMSQLGVITLVGYFELNYRVGYTSIWWPLMEGPALIVMALSGWVIFRFRQTRAMTLAQFFEQRYSRGFRVFAGLVAYLAGIINFAIFPSVGARFFIALSGLPAAFSVAGLEIATYPVVMALLLAFSLLFLFMGGQIAVMVTDFLQGVFCNVAFIVLIVFLLTTFDWDQISEVMLSAPAGQSVVDPFDLGKERHFNVWFYAIGVFILFYCAKGWQGTQGYNCSAKNAHEAKMANILTPWRFRVLMLIVIVLPICARTLMEHPDFSDQAEQVRVALDRIEAPNDDVKHALQNQLRTPLAMRQMLPAGLLGVAFAAMLGAFISTHDTYLHSWGTIFVQDVILPFRKRPFGPKAHLWLLRASIFGVAVFIFVSSLLFQHTQYILMFCALTASVFVGGAGAVIIGGLYWSRGTAAGAWAAMLTGMITSIVGLSAKQVDLDLLCAMAAGGGPLVGALGWGALQLRFALTGQELSFIVAPMSILAYVLVSRLGPAYRHNMDKLLHRGEYAVAGDESASFRDARTIWEKLGFSKDFTGRDRLITYVTLAWPLAWTVIFLVATAWRLAVAEISAEAWAAYWHGWTWFVLICGAIVTTWFAIGGIGDMRYLYRQLRTRHEDLTDDGRVASSVGRGWEFFYPLPHGSPGVVSVGRGSIPKQGHP